MVDKIDLKILHFLSENCRVSLNKISGRLKVSKSTVNYRIKKLEDEGIIKGYSTVINYEASGKINGRLLLKLVNLQDDYLEKIINILKGIKKIIWIASTQGKGDIILTILCDSVKEFNESINEINQKIGKYIINQEVSLASKIYECAPNVIVEGKFIPAVASEYPSEEKTLDELDEKILKELSKNAKISVLELAEKCSCTTKTVISRIGQLEKTGIILRYKAIINTSKFGYDTYHIFWTFNNHDFQKTNTFKEYILNMDETSYLTEALSSSNLECEFLVKNQRELYKLINTLKNREKVRDVVRNSEHLLVYKIHQHY